MSDSENRMPLERATAIANQWMDKFLPLCDRVDVAGSIRRERPTIGDIEIVALPKVSTGWQFQTLLGSDFRQFLAGSDAVPGTEKHAYKYLPSGKGDGALTKRAEWFKATALAVAVREKRPVVFHGGWPGKQTRVALPEGIVLDLFTPDPASWALVFMIRTGSAAFVQQMMIQSRIEGWMCRDGLVYRRGLNDEPEGQPIVLKTEEDVFERFNVRFLLPRTRTSDVKVENFLVTPRKHRPHTRPRSVRA